MKLVIEGKTLFRVKTPQKRAAFVRRQMRAQGFNISTLAEHAGVCWGTMARFADLPNQLGISVYPRGDTERKIFGALGFDVLLAQKGHKGVVEL